MKKILIVVLLLLLLPITTYARTQTKEDILKVIGEIKNVQVEETLIIQNTEVTENKIIFHMIENNKELTKEVSYTFENNTLSFTSGKITNQIENNEAAFYLYSILESKSTASYDIENYYNNLEIEKKYRSINWNQEIMHHYENKGKTFGLDLTKIGNEIQITYHYYLDGDDIIYIEYPSTTDGLVNPETGSFSFWITCLFFLAAGLTAYTFWGDEKKNKVG